MSPARDLAVRLDALRRDGAVDPMDAAFASWVAGLEPTPTAAVVLAACLAARAARGGDVCLDLAEASGVAPWPEAAPDLCAPEPDPWRLAIAAWVELRGEDAPLVWDGGDRVYVRRLANYEERVADDLARRAREDAPAGEDGAVAAALDRLFGPADADAPDHQREAARVAASGRLTVISGGPGTGKTTTVLRVLALLVALAGDRPPRIRMAAPTGKAAARLSASVAEGRHGLVEDGLLDAAAVDAIPETATTVHRLIGARPGGALPRRNAGSPIPADVVVIDEASMVDLALAARVVDALPPDARLILLGDRDQLASVEAGAVLGDLGAAADDPDSPLADRFVTLTHSYRFDEGGGIGRVANAVRAGTASAAIAAIEDGGEEIARVDPDAPGALADAVANGYAHYVDVVRRDGFDPAEALEAFDRFRVLCAVREGPVGVHAVNRIAEDRFRDALGIGRVDDGDPWYRGRPVLVARNDPSAGLANGDVGVAVPVEGGGVRVAFPDGEGGVRRISTARLPSHETCWAMTVHKSQGSEFDRVTLVLPDVADGTPSPVLTRELLYTGLTRARRRVEIHATAATVRHAVATPTRRRTGLARRLIEAGQSNT